MMDRIDHITRRQTDRGYRVVVTLSGGAATATADIPASALRSYSTCQRAILDAAGVMYCDDRYELRGGGRFWREDIADLLDAAEVAAR